MMDLPTFRALLAQDGQEALRAALDLQPREKDFLPHFQTLSRSFPRELARGALEIAILRGEAQTKFPHAEKLYFTREALEQASSHEISTLRAARYRGFDPVADLGCSVGADTLALAAVAPTVGLDRDPLRLAMAQANVAALGLAADFIQTDLLTSFPCLRGKNGALFFDPARRINGRRVFSVNDYAPPLSVISEWLENFPALGVKISPAVKMDELTDYDAEVEFISLHGDLKEAVLWFGPLKTGPRRATVLPGPHVMVDETPPESMRVIAEPRRYFYEPDPAVIRAGMGQTLMARLDAAQIDPEIAYLTADRKQVTPFARVWAVEGWLPFQLKRLRAYLREHHVGLVTVKKRGSPLVPEELIRALRLTGDQERVVFLSQLRGNPIAVICYPEERD